MIKNEQAIKVFDEIRNIPYHISLDGEKGSDCLDKAKMLVPKLRELGYKADTIIGLFRWSSLNLPSSLAEVPHIDECSHMFVQIISDRAETYFIDPTWNKELEKAGFDVADWDGLSSTTLAVPCYRIFSVSESEDYIKGINEEDDMKNSGNFYKAFNEYCDSFLARKGD